MNFAFGPAAGVVVHQSRPYMQHIYHAVSWKNANTLSPNVKLIPESTSAQYSNTSMACSANAAYTRAIRFFWVAFILNVVNGKSIPNFARMFVKFEKPNVVVPVCCWPRATFHANKATNRYQCTFACGRRPSMFVQPAWTHIIRTHTSTRPLAEPRATGIHIRWKWNEVRFCG